MRGLESLLVLVFITFLGGIYIRDLHLKLKDEREYVSVLEDRCVRNERELMAQNSKILDLEFQLSVSEKNAEELLIEKINLQEQNQQLKEQIRSQTQEIKMMSGDLKVLYTENQELSLANGTLDSIIQSIITEYTALLEEHQQCEQNEEEIFARVSAPVEQVSGAINTDQLPKNFGRMALNISLIIILITILSAAIQGLSKSMRRKFRSY